MDLNVNLQGTVNNLRNIIKGFHGFLQMNLFNSNKNSKSNQIHTFVNILFN